MAELSKRAKAVLILPDDEAQSAIGRNVLDPAPALRPPAPARPRRPHRRRGAAVWST
jgi:hypothetical protein